MERKLSSRTFKEFPLEVLSQEQIQQIYATREAILAHAKQTVDPTGAGIDFVMMATDDGDFFGTTEEQQFQDWLDWAEQLIRIISLFSQRIGLAIVTVGLAFAGGTMIANERTIGLGEATLGVAGLFAVWFVVANLMQATRFRK